MSDWKQVAAKELAIQLGMIPPVQVSPDGMREIIKWAYERRARYNFLIGRAEDALAEMDPDYGELRKRLEA